MSGINLKVTTESFVTDSKAWMKSQYGFNTARPCTISLAAFGVNERINDMIPSGTVLGKITASGLYGPYDNAAATGVEVAAGLLLNGVRFTRDADETGTMTASGAAFVWQGIVSESKLPVFPSSTKGEIDATGKTDLPQIRWEA